MTIRHLKIFITVAECGKMRKAAELLYISQPTVSQAIAELEQYYGMKFFERLSQKIYLTERGEELLDYARHIVSSFESMDLAMKYAAAMPKLRLGGSVSVGTRFFEPLVTKMEEIIPELDLRVVINNTDCIEQMIKESKLDLGIVEGRVEEKDIVTVPISQDELVIVVGRTHPFYGRDRIELKELENENYIAREDKSSSRNQYEHLLLEHHMKLTPKWSSTNMEPIKRAVIAGKGFAILSRLVIEREVAEGSMRVITVAGVNVKREIKLIYHKDKYLSPQLLKLIEIAKMIGSDLKWKDGVEEGTNYTTSEDNSNCIDFEFTKSNETTNK